MLNVSRQYHLPLVEALCAFVRETSPARLNIDQVATDVQAALTVLKRREKSLKDGTELGEWPLNLGETTLPMADLSGAKFAWANLSEDNLSSADLHNANLFQANLYKANLSGANLSKASLDGAILVEANLSKAKLINASLSGAFLDKANLSGADLSGANATQLQLDRACGTDATRLPPGLRITVCDK
jgi:uncharacterized protein YjbI with pentapeptide repeats